MVDSLNYRIVQADDDIAEIRYIESQFKKFAGADSVQLISAGSIADLRSLIATEQAPDALLLDVHFKNENATGVDLLSDIKKSWPTTAVIIRSSDKTLIHAALAKGADDFIGKEGFEGEICVRTLRTIAFVKALRGQSPAPGRDSPIQTKLIGKTMSQVAQRVTRIIGSAARVVHVFGESGTGKEIVADLFASALGKSQPLVRVNCGAISESLFEGELFGSVKGAYSGSIRDKAGLIEEADGGFLYLDEVASIPESCQVKLLRVIDNQEFRRLGDNTLRKINVRIITATNEDLSKLVADGTFRNDLHQRLSESIIDLPPLRERMDEVIPLIKHFCQVSDGGPYKITDGAIEILCSYAWVKGNVRELRNCIRAMTENHIEKLLTPLSIPKSFWDSADAQHEDIATSSADTELSREKPKDGPSVDIKLTWQGQAHAAMADLLLLEMIKAICKDPKRRSLRHIGATIGVGRTTIAEKLRLMVSDGILSADTLNNLVNLKK